MWSSGCSRRLRATPAEVVEAQEVCARSNDWQHTEKEGEESLRPELGEAEGSSTMRAWRLWLMATRTEGEARGKE